jgi:hypothetical protein
MWPYWMWAWATATAHQCAQALLHHRIPNLFHTSHGAAMQEAWPQAPVLAKPVSSEAIVARVAALVIDPAQIAVLR